MPFVGCCALVYFWTLRFSRIGDFYTLRLGFFGNLDLRIIKVLTSSSVFCIAKYRGGVRRTEGLENAGSGGDRVRFPLPLLIVNKTGGNARKVKGLASTT